MALAAQIVTPANKPRNEIASQLKSLSSILAVLVILLALIVLVGWRFDIDELKSIVPNLVAMKANEAICFLLAGSSLLLIRFASDGGRLHYLQQICAAGVLLISVLTLGEYLSGSNLGIDQLLFKVEKQVTGISNPGRMSPNASFNFILLGVGLMMASSKSVRDYRPSQLLALVVFLFAAMAWMGYTTGVQSFEGISSYTRMAVPTTIAFMLASISALCAYSDRGFMATLTSDNAGGIAARRLLPAALGLPLILAWLKASGEQAGLYANDVGTWLLVLATLLAFGFLVLLTIKPLERADRKLKETAVELERSNSELENFAYIASHDLKQPLRRIKGYTQLLTEQYRGKLDSEADEFIDYTVDSANRMQELIDDLLAFSRVDTDGRSPTLVDSCRICDEAIADLHVALDESNTKISHGEMPVITADPIQLEQIFLNLIGNAVKFNNGEPPLVRIDAELTDGEWVFSVKDNGIGIEPQYSERIFEIFKRLSTRKEYPGTGLGLAICKKIVERGGGRIWFDSKPGAGSTFYFSVPLTKED